MVVANPTRIVCLKVFLLSQYTILIDEKTWFSDF